MYILTFYYKINFNFKNIKLIMLKFRKTTFLFLLYIKMGPQYKLSYELLTVQY